ncbi:MAG: hypothetical protein WKI04_04545 [Ferruginibacter sp.]
MNPQSIGDWVHGDCWSAQADYSPDALAAFKKETGIATVPRTPHDKDYYEFMDFNRKKFRKYVAHYVDAIHKFNPKFLITSNWAYSSMMPEKVDTDLDFLSGDMATRSYVSNAAFEARCLAPQGKPWDLMSWGFTNNWVDGTGSYKSVVQLEQEAAHVLSMGGGYQVYYPQNHDASIKLWKVKDMAEVANFCRQRQAFTYRAKAVPQIAMLHSTEDFKHILKGLYNNWGIFDGQQEILNVLLDGQNLVEILIHHNLLDRMKDYKVIVIPEWYYLAPEFITKLKNYVNKGGNLLVIGAEAVKLFEKDLGVTFGPFNEKNNLNLGNNNDIATVVGKYQQVALNAGIKSFDSFYSEQDLRFPTGIPASITNFGKVKLLLFTYIWEKIIKKERRL